MKIPRIAQGMSNSNVTDTLGSTNSMEIIILEGFGGWRGYDD